MFTSEITTTKPLCKITIHDINSVNAITTERALTVANVELTGETLDLLFRMMDRERGKNA
jgi:hypothetical protein